jgi:hypothetical protein
MRLSPVQLRGQEPGPCEQEYPAPDVHIKSLTQLTFIT